MTEHLFASSLVAGCDPSSKKLAVVVAHPDGRVTTHVWRSLNKKWVPDSCLSASEWIKTEFQHMDPGVVWIEEPVVGRAGIRSSVVQAFVSGAVQAAFLLLGWSVLMVNVQTWKVSVTRNGHGSKHDVATAVAKLWPEAHRLASGDGDLIDAAAICLHGRGPRPSAD